MASKKPELPLDFDKMFQDYIDANQKVWENDRNKTMGASETFGCLRQAFFKKHGYEVDDPDAPFAWGACERGNIIEDHFIVPAFEFLPDKYEYLGGGGEQETLVKGLLSATPDGVLTGLPSNALANYGIENIETDCIVTEFKSIDPRVNLREEKAIHRGQVIQQMGLIRELTVLEPTYAIIIYVDASFLDDITYFTVKWNPKSYSIAKKRAKSVYRATDPMDVRAEGLITGGCEFCEFSKRCGSLIVDAIPDDNGKVDEKAMEEMARLVAVQQDLGAKKKAAETKHKQANEDIKEFLRDNEVNRITGENWSTSYGKIDGRVTYDTKAMLEDGFDLNKYKKVGAAYDKLNVRSK